MSKNNENEYSWGKDSENRPIGGGGVTAVVIDGTEAAPSIRVQSDQDTGLYKVSDGVMGFSSNGVLSAKLSSSGITLNEVGVIDNGSGEAIEFTADSVILKANGTTSVTAYSGGLTFPLIASINNSGGEALNFTDGTGHLTADHSNQLSFDSSGVTVQNGLTVNGAFTSSMGPISGGSWTPTFTGTFIYTTQTGHYTRIGKQVIATFTVTWTLLPISSVFLYMNLPVAAGDTVGGGFFSKLHYNVGASNIGTTMHIASGYIEFWMLRDYLAEVQMESGDLQSAGTLSGHIMYILI